MKAELELAYGDGVVFLNFWNAENGDDVVCEFVDDKLYLVEYDDDERTSNEITLGDFIEIVKIKMQRMHKKHK